MRLSGIMDFGALALRWTPRLGAALVLVLTSALIAWYVAVSAEKPATIGIGVFFAAAYALAAITCFRKRTPRPFATHPEPDGHDFSGLPPIAGSLYAGGYAATGGVAAIVFAWFGLLVLGFSWVLGEAAPIFGLVLLGVGPFLFACNREAR